MKKRFTLQFPDQNEDDLIALVFINHLGRKKSKFLSNAVNNYLLDIQKIFDDHIEDEVMIERLEESLKALYGEDFDIMPYLESAKSDTPILKKTQKPQVKPPVVKKPVVDLTKVKQEIKSNTPTTPVQNKTTAVSEKEVDQNLRSDDHKVLAKQGVSEAETKNTNSNINDLKETDGNDTQSELERLRKELALKEAKLKEVQDGNEKPEEQSSDDDIEKMKLASSALDFFK